MIKRYLEYQRQLRALFLVCNRDREKMKMATREAARLQRQDPSVSPTEAVRRVKQRLVIEQDADPTLGT